MKTYLNNLINELPTNCLFDKGKVGCGGTSMAIECNKPYVICVPFTSLVENKLQQYPNERRTEKIFGVYAGATIKEIKDYVESVKCPKIIVTYNSLPKVISAVNTKEYSLLVDEYHILFNQYSFRKDAIKPVLENYELFKDFTFMTATPLEEEFVLDELKDLELVKQEWDDVIETKVQAVKCKNVEASTIKLINAVLNNQVEGNVYIFVNSVDFIKNLIQKAKLTEENTRVIYSKNNKTKLSIHNSTVLDEPKKINLLTSTVFEGSDIYDENGRIVVVSDAQKAQTLLDISTSIQQIAGRIRNSKYLNWITHLYSATRYADISYEDFKKKNIQNIEETKIAVDAYNAMPEVARKKLKEFTSDTYIQVNDDFTFTFDPNMAKVDIFNFKVTRGLYSIRTNLNKEYIKNGFKKVIECEDNSIKIDFESDNKPFKELIKEVRTEWENKFKLNTPLLNDAIIKYPWLPEAISKLGFEKMASLKYCISDIKDALLKKSNKSADNKAAKKLNQSITLGMWYSNADIKKFVKEAYEISDITITPKATEIDKYYEVKKCQKRVNGKQTEGYVIINKKFVFNK
jgi:hypothetical protein